MSKIKIIGAIDEDAYTEFCNKLDDLETGGVKVITVELNSGGGTAYDALAIAGRMRTSKCKFTVTGYGLIASAAVLILAAGDVRVMTKEAWVMVHEDSGRIKGNIVTMELEALHFRRLENQWAGLLAERTLTKAEVWTKLHKETTYLSAEECLALGLVDKVI
jgi:ATP-dependent Clp protease protease subunit